MDKGKVKNFIIALLAAVNLFFLAAVILDGAEAEAVRQQARQETVAILQKAGISLRDERLLDTEPVSQLNLRRDLDKELSMVKSVLGRDASVVDRGGNIYVYASSEGEAKFSGTGEFSISHSKGSTSLTRVKDGDHVETAVSYLRKMGLSADAQSAVVGHDDDLYTVILTCRWNDVDVLVCRIKFTFSQTSIKMVEGRRTLDVVSGEDGQDALDAPTALMRFLDLKYESGLVCSEIRALEPAYMLDDSVSGAVTLIPCWRIVTDVGEHMINGMTGKVAGVF